MLSPAFRHGLWFLHIPAPLSVFPSTNGHFGYYQIWVTLRKVGNCVCCSQSLLAFGGDRSHVPLKVLRGRAVFPEVLASYVRPLYVSSHLLGCTISQTAFH
jgi:hypothetical protein